jgi:flagellar hook-associated protein 2
MVTGISGFNSQIDSLVQQYRASQRKFIVPLENRKTSLTARIKALADLKAKLEDLDGISKGLMRKDSTSTLAVHAAKSSDDSVLIASASSGNASGIHTITVTQLAKQDTVLSSRVSSQGNSIVTNFGAGERYFTMTIQGVTTDINVVIEDDDTNATVMNKIATAVNSSGTEVVASVINDTTSTSRLVLKSKETGSENAIVLNESGGGLLHAIGLSSDVLSGRKASSSSEAGYLHASSNMLDAHFIMDGVEVVRGSNVISDVLRDVTLTLKNTSEDSVNLNISPDVEKIKENIEKFINSYNDVINYLTSRTSIDTDVNVRQIFASDTQVRGLRIDLRMIASGIVSGIEEGKPNSLYDLGIQVRSDGTLFFADTGKFENAVMSDINALAKIFHAENGVAVQFNNRLQNFVSNGGFLENSREGADGQLRNLNSRIEDMQRRIDVRVERFRDEFIKMQSMIAAANQQLQMLNNLKMFYMG